MNIFNITIVIPTHYRHKYLNRLLDYYRDINIKLLVADSSDIEFADKNNYTIEYFHYPDLNYLDKMHNIVNEVKTPYILFCADDDFWVKESLAQCMEFLEDNKDYSSAQGKYIGFEDKKETSFIPAYLHAKSIEDDEIDKRLNACMDNYMPLFYAMHRTEVLKKVFNDNYNTGINHAILNELSVSLYSLIYGKHKVLDILTYARDDDSEPTPVQRDNLKDIALKEEFQNEYKQFKINVRQFLDSLYPRIYSANTVEHALSLYIEKINIEQALGSSRLKEILKKCLYFIRPFIIEQKRKNIKKIAFKKTNSIKGYPHTDERAKKQWDEIVSYIKNKSLS